MKKLLLFFAAINCIPTLYAMEELDCLMSTDSEMLSNSDEEQQLPLSLRSLESSSWSSSEEDYGVELIRRIDRLGVEIQEDLKQTADLEDEFDHLRLELAQIGARIAAQKSLPNNKALGADLPEGNLEKLDCSVCFDSKPKSEFLKLACEHEFCVECINDQLVRMLELFRVNQNIKATGMNGLLKCMGKGCDHVLGMEDIRMLAQVHGDEESLPQIMLMLSAGFCFDCREVHGENALCVPRNQNINNNNNAAAPEGTKRCTGCNSLVFRPDGCNHMTCYVDQGGCGAHWCWLCEEPWGFTHVPHLLTDRLTVIDSVVQRTVEVSNNLGLNSRNILRLAGNGGLFLAALVGIIILGKLAKNAVLH